MLDQTPEESLIVGDAGFIGYDFWSAIMENKKHFLVRVGGNVRLLRKLGYATKERGNTVYLWPQNKRDQEPLVLRLIQEHDGKQPMSLVTNLPEDKLSDKDALEIYRRRWGIEVFFRTLKQTFDRRKLRCTGAKNAPLELEWSLITLWGMCLIGEECIDQTGVDISRMSPAKIIKSFETVIWDYRVMLDSSDELLKERLKGALMDDYERTKAKTNREYPRKSQKKKIHEPIIETASEILVTQTKAVKLNTAAA